MRHTVFIFVLAGCSTVPQATFDEPSVSPESEEATRPSAGVLDVRASAGTFELVNVSSTPQKVLPALDGSSLGWRIPAVEVVYRDAAGNSVQPESYGRCGNMNRLVASDWVTLAPGETLTIPGQWGRIAPPQGAVQMQLTYDTRLGSVSRPLGDGGGDPLVAFAELPEGVWTSPWTEVP